MSQCCRQRRSFEPSFFIKTANRAVKSGHNRMNACISKDEKHFYILPARKTLAMIPASVATNAPVSVYPVFFTFAAIKYTLMV